MAHILVMDDEKDIATLIKRVLEKDGHQITVKHCATGLGAEDFQIYDLLLLDVMMPEIDGFSLCAKIRKSVDCPILFLTAKSMEEDVVEGFALGGDDYIKKPFSIAELRARVAAHLRRENREHHQMLVCGKIRFDLSAKTITVIDEIEETKQISLTKSEYEICEYLAKNKGQVFSLEHILERIFGYDVKSDASAIRMHIKNIRSKIVKYTECPIETVWGVGYKWK